MAQKRITVPEQVQIRAKELQNSLGVSNLGEVFALLITRYGSHLQKTWEFTTTSHESITELKTANNLSVTPHPENAPFEPDDPVIKRLAALVDNF